MRENDMNDAPPLDRWRLDAVLTPAPFGKLWGLPMIVDAAGVSIDTARRWARNLAAPIHWPVGAGNYFAFLSELRDWQRGKTPE